VPGGAELAPRSFDLISLDTTIMSPCFQRPSRPLFPFWYVAGRGMEKALIHVFSVVGDRPVGDDVGRARPFRGFSFEEPLRGDDS